jgi:hypothetical protein
MRPEEDHVDTTRELILTDYMDFHELPPHDSETTVRREFGQPGYQCFSSC